MYFSLVPNPGYNTSLLDTRGIDGEWELFSGVFYNENNGNSGTWVWKDGNDSIEGNLPLVR